MEGEGSSRRGSSEDDVFLSFAGEDTLTTVIYPLCDALSGNKINFYVDTEKEDKDVVARRHAIIKSKLAVVILSEHYAQSPRYLDELVFIFECQQNLELVVVPVFYQVAPSDVRKQRGVCEVILHKHELEYDPGIVNKWRAALERVASLSGWDLTTYGHGSNYIESIVSDIVRRLRGKYDLETQLRAKHGMEQQLRAKHDIFLSFCSKDTQNNFTSHLYAALRSSGVTAYNFDVKEEDAILFEVEDAIQISELYVVVFSKSYAFSSRCCSELEHIATNSEKFGRSVVPIFYDVDPSSVQDLWDKIQIFSVDLNKQSGSESGFWARKQMLGVDSDKEHQSKIGLSSTAYSSAWDSKSIKPESKLIEEVVEDILKKLKRISPKGSFNGLVGIPARIDHVKSMLDKESSKVGIVSIVGTAGLGKTTLAKVLFDQISIQFEASCFLSNIRELWMSGRRRYLRKKLDSALKFDKEMLKNKKVLIVLDDVEEAEQLELLVGSHDQYGNGSRIITTSRNYTEFKAPSEVYQMKELSFAEALLLFQLNAFRTRSYTEEFMELSKKMVRSFKNFNPLTLKVLGSTLYGKVIQQWKEVLRHLEDLTDVSNDETQRVLRLSFHQLETVERNVFLDIACFFKGEEEALTKRILDGCHYHGCRKVESLLDKSLITVLDSKLWMHDSLEDLGKKIVLEKREDDGPGYQSRLWDSEDVYHVLSRTKGTKLIEALIVDMSKIGKVVNVSSDVFSYMYNIRMLKIHSHFANCILQFYGGYLESLPNGLRYLYWDAYPFDSLPSRFTGWLLVEIRLQFSKVKKLWNKALILQHLKVMDLSFSKELMEIPDLSGTPVIESLCLRGCVRLKEVPLYFQNLRKLVHLNLEDCSSIENVRALPENIITVNLARCSRLKSLPANTSMLKYLRRLELSGCSSFNDPTRCKKV